VTAAVARLDEYEYQRRMANSTPKIAPYFSGLEMSDFTSQ
jgi:hypothetical protein